MYYLFISWDYTSYPHCTVTDLNIIKIIYDLNIIFYCDIIFGNIIKYAMFSAKINSTHYYRYYYNSKINYCSTTICYYKYRIKYCIL